METLSLVGFSRPVHDVIRTLPEGVETEDVVLILAFAEIMERRIALMGTVKASGVSSRRDITFALMRAGQPASGRVLAALQNAGYRIDGQEILEQVIRDEWNPMRCVVRVSEGNEQEDGTWRITWGMVAHPMDAQGGTVVLRVQGSTAVLVELSIFWQA